jgi:hypothetical protein
MQEHYTPVSGSSAVTSENIFDFVRMLQSPTMFSHERISLIKKERRKSILKADERIRSCESFGD